MIKHLRPAVMLTILMTALTGLAYPLAMTGVAQRIFPHQANGGLIERDGKVIGSELIGQNFTSPAYFHGRPSATTDTDPNDPTKTAPAPYNAGNSGGSNLGPTSKALVDRVTEEAKTLSAQNPAAPVPVDLVTTSASGLDPDITPAAALFQVPRVATARKLSEDQLRRLVDANTTGRLFGLLGEPHVNVLKLNLALDKEFPTRGSPATAESASAAEAALAPAAPTVAQQPKASAEAAPETAAATPAAPAAGPPEAAASMPPPSSNLAAQAPQVEGPGSKAAALFPAQISPAYAGEKPHVARRKTCFGQFHANVADKANGGLKWKEYWKECEKHLKG